MNTTKKTVFPYSYTRIDYTFVFLHVVKIKKITKTKDFTEINKLCKRLQTFSK
jgi:hypothetical protein